MERLNHWQVSGLAMLAAGIACVIGSVFACPGTGERLMAVGVPIAAVGVWFLFLGDY